MALTLCICAFWNISKVELFSKWLHILKEFLKLIEYYRWQRLDLEILWSTSKACESRFESWIIKMLWYRCSKALFVLLYNEVLLFFSLISILLLPSEAGSVSEFGFPIPEGIHRCTTKTTTFSLNPNHSKSKFHSRVLGKCKNNAEFECMRDFHLYKLDSINALLIVADPKCENCRFDPYKDKPEEGL